ncbi:MAG TPA: HYR domain-containing protein, partial [Vicingaceae bacterium]
TNDAPASFPIGNTTVTWTSTDGSSNFVTCTQVVTVVDNEAPVITCPSDTVVGNTPGLCGAVVNYTAPVGTDNCTGATTVLVSGLASGSTFPVGTTTVVYAVVDGSNNGDTCSFNVTVADSLAPTAVCQDITIYLDNTGNVNILGTDVDGGSSDDCAIDTLTLSQYNFTCSAIGTNNVTLYVTDTYGNIDSCTAIVTVMDTVGPTVICQNINVYVDNAGNVSIIPNDIDGGSSDMCGISAITASQTTFTCAELGLNNVTLYVEDNNGNIDSCVAQVTVYDTIAPTITCPTNQEVSTDNTCMYEIEDYTSLATASMDNCDMNNVIITQMPAAGTLVTADNIINDKGQTVVTIIVEDLSGNADTCEFIVDVTCIDALTIPNVFTPNGDGKNDLWNIAGKENYPDMKVKVFNRWGDLMFESESGYNNPWDGKYNNTEAPAATYYYVIMLGNDEEDLSGTINIVR